MEFMLPFNKTVADRQIKVKYKILESMSETTKFCLDWRVYKSILYHIVSNAVKFSNNQGKIGIEIHYSDSNEILSDDSIEGLENQPNETSLKFGTLTTIVVDNGVGMNEKQLRKLGQSF